MISQKEQAMELAAEGGASSSLIIGMGASAGGLEALQQFFGNMPGGSGLSFVVVQHLSPDYKSLLAEILSKHTLMKVIQAENAMEVLPNVVYLIPPKNKMVLRDGKLYLTESVHGSINHPIDIFFNSLAEEMKERSIAVVFSGTGSDGTNGIKSIKEQGGLVIVQDPISAKFDGMPKNAINTGLADFILNPQEIASEILNYCNYPTIIQPSESKEIFSDEELLARIYTILKKFCGIDYTHYKRNTILRRIERRMMVTHNSSLEDFVHLLETNEEEARLLGREILIGVTNFFRDPEFFEKLKEQTIYKLLEQSDGLDTLRLWVAGCSTGEEAYSIAILLHEAMEEMKIKREIKIFATDVDTRAIEVAGKGNFSESIIDDVTPERLSKYFTKKGDRYQINKEIRRMIIFAPHNMFTDPPFGKLDLISCRNVMIYFQPILQKNLFAIFHSALKDGGFLFLGKSETANEFSDVFKPLCPAEKIYLHLGEGKMPEMITSMFMAPSIMPMSSYMGNETERQELGEVSSDAVYMQVLEKFLPATVVINSKNDVIHFFGNHADYLTISSGRATLNIFNLISNELSLAVSTALNRCRKENTTVTYADITVDSSSGRREIDLIVQPVFNHADGNKDLIAIIFEEQKRTETHGVTEKYNIDETAARRIADLEGELQRTQNDLKVTVSELETVNEELQASNEELLTANEELQSSNEELQSVNEELYTVNAEYQQKLDELTEMTNDLGNFLSSTMIGILFVDSKLNIRKFTEYIGREFQLMEHDIGRSMQIFAHSFPDDQLIADAKVVIKTLTPIDREVTATNGRSYTLRIAPYRTTENSIKGLVFTIIDSLLMKL
jgi:two-component system CheB/CheR fusion protein